MDATKKIVKLFDAKRPTITKHLKNIFDIKKLNKKAVCSILEHTAEDKKKYKITFYNFDVVIAVDYRVNSKRVTRFRIWATQILKEYIIKGFATWKNAPKGRIRKTDVLIAKNYLDERELNLLNRIVTMYLDYADMQAQKGVVMYMKNWVEKLNAFLRFTEYEILTNAGKISHKVAEELALGEYEKFKVEQDKNYISDFDKEVKKLLKTKK